MGADGGVCWVHLREPIKENRKKLKDILPWPLLYFDHRDQNDDFEAPNDTITSTYGTSQDWDLSDLQEILGELEEESQEYKEQTLYELLEDAYTCPVHNRIGGWYVTISTLQKLLLETCLGWHVAYKYSSAPIERFLYTFEDIENKDKKLLEMKLKDWELEVRNCIYDNWFGREETWT